MINGYKRPEDVGIFPWNNPLLERESFFQFFHSPQLFIKWYLRVNKNPWIWGAELQSALTSLRLSLQLVFCAQNGGNFSQFKMFCLTSMIYFAVTTIFLFEFITYFEVFRNCSQILQRHKTNGSLRIYIHHRRAFSSKESADRGKECARIRMCS